MIIFEDNHLLIVNKPPGILVQGDQTQDPTILDTYKAYIKKKYAKPGGIYLHPAHRLDRPVSGCLILVKTSKALSRMTVAFKEGKVEKMYHAICTERYQETEGVLVHFIQKDPERNISKVVKDNKRAGKRCELKYRLVASVGSKVLYRLRPVTGRSHQIRVQLSAIGCPILGDVKYKGKTSADPRAIYLHCTSLSFIHPTTKEMIIVTAPPPNDQNWQDFKSFLAGED